MWDKRYNSIEKRTTPMTFLQVKLCSIPHEIVGHVPRELSRYVLVMILSLLHTLQIANINYPLVTGRAGNSLESSDVLD